MLTLKEARPLTAKLRKLIGSATPLIHVHMSHKIPGKGYYIGFFDDDTIEKHRISNREEAEALIVELKKHIQEGAKC